MAFFISKMWDARDFVNVALAVVDRVSHDEISWQRHYPGRLGDLVTSQASKSSGNSDGPRGLPASSETGAVIRNN